MLLWLPSYGIFLIAARMDQGSWHLQYCPKIHVVHTAGSLGQGQTPWPAHRRGEVPLDQQKQRARAFCL